MTLFSFDRNRRKVDDKVTLPPGASYQFSKDGLTLYSVDYQTHETKKISVPSLFNDVPP